LQKAHILSIKNKIGNANMLTNLTKLQKILIVLIGIPLCLLLAFKATSGMINYKGIFMNLFVKSVDYKSELAVTKKVYTKTEEGSLDFNKSYIINILFLGIDRTIERDYGTEAIYRTDTISVIRIDLNTKKIKILCIPRDTYAFVPIEKKKDKINHAYAFGKMQGKAIEASTEAVNQLIKYAPIDYYFALDIKPLPEIINAIGGIEVDVEMDMKNWETDLSKGKQLLNGKKAYEYIHWRYSKNGDIDRIQRQQKFLKLLFQKLKASDKLVDVTKIVLSYRENLKTDLSTKQILGLANLSSEISEENIKYYMIPGSGKTINKVSYYVPNDKETDKLLREFFSTK
jgi:LCP family protein required for cell wall assembly